uniref:NADH dehydrogenase subunit 6 n=1 Tax=Hyperhalosydna striata TaxID=1210421 RepID=UPI002008ED02|nr:NADH dehydrogenase subunit 6 [Hyperhalosydna striata]QTZ18395.1 NADH dehydrogenase subunit 6 [Hyperhalosydna striata]
MLLFISSSLFISLSLSLILASSPLSMGLWVLLIALAAAFFVGVMFNSWFSFIIFLIYIGGMLVMFAYFAALTPNQPLGLLSMLLASMFTLLLILLILILVTFSSPNLFSPMMPNPVNGISILYSPSNSYILLLLASILFFVLVAVVKVANINKGPLRPFN